MSQVTTIVAEDRAQKGTAREFRRQGKVPAVIYGDKKSPLSIAIADNVVARFIGSAGFFTHLFDIDIDGVKHRVLPRDVQYHPVTDRPLHIDFLRVSQSTKMRVSIPFSFVDQDKSPGIRRGGTLNIVHHEIEVLCSPNAIPEKFEISLDGLNVNEAVHLSSVKFPEGVAPTTHERDYTIATIAVPSAVRSSDAAATTTDAAAPAAAGKAAPAAAGKAAAPAAKAPAAKK